MNESDDSFVLFCFYGEDGDIVASQVWDIGFECPFEVLGPDITTVDDDEVFRASCDDDLVLIHIA